jgi:hypothetical protein
MEALWWLGTHLGVYLVWAAWTVLSWLVLQLFWAVLWVAMPVIVAAVLCAIAAERLIGKEPVRSWIRTHAYRLLARALHRARRAVFGLAALPVRVVGWFVIYTIWHAVISLWWTPCWSPWQCAWRCRWGHNAMALAQDRRPRTPARLGPSAVDLKFLPDLRRVRAGT